MNEKLYSVSSSPHIRNNDSTAKIMLKVIIALIPTSVAGIYFFGMRALLILLFSTACAVFFEALWCFLTKKDMTIGDLSAAVTGLLLGLNVSSATPLWAIVFGNAFAIIIVKQLFGGLGHNFMNPAMSARVFMLICWPATLTVFPKPFQGADAVSSATFLSGGEVPTYMNAFLGNMDGCIGEVSALAIIIGGVYLICAKVMKPDIPVIYIGTMFVITTLAGEDGLLHILSGGLMIGAFFMATDYVTSPVSRKGKIIYGIGCGVVTSVIRLWGGYPDGVSFAILLMNAATQLIDKATMPKKYGAVSGRENKKC